MTNASEGLWSINPSGNSGREKINQISIDDFRPFNGLVAVTEHTCSQLWLKHQSLSPMKCSLPSVADSDTSLARTNK